MLDHEGFYGHQAPSSNPTAVPNNKPLSDIKLSVAADFVLVPGAQRQSTHRLLRETEKTAASFYSLALLARSWS